MRYEFVEVLNDLIDYFLIGDLRLLKKYKDDHELSDDLASEFASNDSGDRAVEGGIVIPLAGIENYPYTIILTFLMRCRSCLSRRAVYSIGAAATFCGLKISSSCSSHGGFCKTSPMPISNHCRNAIASQGDHRSRLRTACMMLRFSAVKCSEARTTNPLLSSF